MNSLPLKINLKLLSLYLLLPGIITSAVISNQISWEFGPIIGKILGWITDLSAVGIVLSNFRRKLWPIILTICIVLSKMAYIITGSGIADLAYVVLLSFLFCTAGAVICAYHFKLLYKQILIICFINLIFMMMQAAGVGGKYTQFLSTHVQKGETTWEPHPVLFVKNVETLSIIQRRPAGLLYANQYLSLVVLFAIMLHFSYWHKRSFFATFVMCATVVLSMSKIVILGFVFMVVLIIFIGNYYQRHRIVLSLFLTSILLWLYILLFPGMFQKNIQFTEILYSIFTRVGNILYAYNPNNELLATLNALTHAPGNLTMTNYMNMEERISGYMDIVPYLKQFMIVLYIFVPCYLMGILKMRKRFPHLPIACLSGILFAIITPSVGPLWRTPIYGFLTGFALLPMFVLLQPKYFQENSYFKKVYDDILRRPKNKLKFV